ncbi:MAG: hypothetical protein ACOC10_10725, partial [Bacteroidota bacterium]
MPFPSNELVLPHNVAVAQYKNGAWEMVPVVKTENNAAYISVDQFTPMVLLSKQSSVVAYGSGSVYTGSDVVNLAVSVELRNSAASADQVSLQIAYREQGQSQIETETLSFDLISGSVVLDTVLNILGPVEIVTVGLVSAPDGIDYSLNSGITAQ